MANARYEAAAIDTLLASNPQIASNGSATGDELTLCVIAAAQHGAHRPAFRPESHCAGTLTTGAPALSPVPEIENSIITNAKLYLDWMSVSVIQNQRAWYSTAA